MAIQMWMSEEERNHISRVFQRLEAYWMFHFKPADDIIRQKRKKENVVLAYAKIGQTQKVIGFSKEAGVAYKVDQGYKITTEKWKKFTFIRFLRGHDI